MMIEFFGEKFKMLSPCSSSFPSAQHVARLGDCTRREDWYFSCMARDLGRILEAR